MIRQIFSYLKGNKYCNKCDDTYNSKMNHCNLCHCTYHNYLPNHCCKCKSSYYYQHHCCKCRREHKFPNDHICNN